MEVKEQTEQRMELKSRIEIFIQEVHASIYCFQVAKLYTTPMYVCISYMAMYIF